MTRRIITLQRQARELGRLRSGYTDTTGSKPRPVRSATWIVTSHSRDYVDAAAAEWGGRVEQWQPQGNGAPQWRVITDTAAVDAILPPGDPLSQSYELWTRGGCARRCDGMTESLSDQPCRCLAEFGENFHEQPAGKVCDLVTRLNVMLPAMPDIGVWRVETHSYYAANEIAGHVDTIRGIVGPTAMVPVRLRIEQRTRVAEGKTKHFPVVVVELRGVTAGQVLAGTADLRTINAASTPPAIEAAPAGPSYADRAAAATTVDAVRAVWTEAAAANHLTDDLKHALEARAAALTATAEPTALPAGVDADALWVQIVATVPDDWNDQRIRDEFAAASGGVAVDAATAEELWAFLQRLTTRVPV